MTTIQIHFSEDVRKPNGRLLDGSEMTLFKTGPAHSGPVPVTPLSGVFVYNPDTYVATWRFSQLGADKYRIEILPTAVSDRYGRMLDGHWDNLQQGTPDE